jgi:glyoxylase-like metal-dependent hydrolase (beta-lactamase superfamily II)
VAVDRELHEGDELDAGFVVLETPGHSPGHVSYWREEDRTLIAGDVLFGRHPITGRPGLHEPPERFTLDVARNRASIRRVAALRPRLVVFGHGRPHRDPDALEAFALALPGAS